MEYSNYELIQQVGTDAHAPSIVDDSIILGYLHKVASTQVLQGQSDGVLSAEGVCSRLLLVSICRQDIARCTVACGKGTVYFIGYSLRSCC